MSCFYLQDILYNYNNSEKRISSVFWGRKSGKFLKLRESAEWYWFTRVYPVLSRVLAILSGVFSFLIVLGEVTLFIDIPVSPFPLFFQKQHTAFLTKSFCLLLLLYILYSGYIALFKLKLKGLYGMYSHNQTDSINLLWCSLIMTRVAPALCYNFLLFIQVDGTQFSKVMGVIDLVPLLGQDFAEYFPLLLIFFCLLNYYQAYSKVMKCLGVPQFSFSEEMDEGMVEEGKALVERERKTREKGTHSFEEVKVSKEDIVIAQGSRYYRLRNTYSEITTQLQKPLNATRNLV